MINYAQISKNYFSGLSDQKNANLVGCSKATVRNWRNKNNYPSNFKATKDVFVDQEKIIELNRKGSTDSRIAKELFISEKTVNFYRRKLGLLSNQSHNIFITKNMEAILIGTILGDSYLSCRANSKEKKRAKTAQLIFGHTIKQSNFVFWKWKNLKSLFNRKPKYNFQTRNDKVNRSFYCYSMCSLSLLKYHKLFYKDWIKIIPKNIDKYLTPLSLAVLFMDDGYKGPYICLNNFDLASINNFQNALYKLWKIDSSVTKRKELYIPARSKKKFEDLIKPFIIQSMTYKLSL